MQLLNLGVLAHVDAGKTTLTERLLFDAGAIDSLGSVDKGTTQTDTLELERRRGITIRSAVASFHHRGTTINLIDTPGHPDFIAEVERALAVLDGAVLVVSAVEGVQPQTRLLFRALHRLRVPTLLFVNKIDRTGADDLRTTEAIRARLSERVVALGAATGLGSVEAAYERFGPDDPRLLASLRHALGVPDDGAPGALGERLAADVASGSAHAIVAGSALTGAGCVALLDAVVELLPVASRDVDGETSARVFKIERSATGEPAACVRVFHGSIRQRQRLDDGGRRLRPVTAIEVFEDAGTQRRARVDAGQIARVWGLSGVCVGDVLGVPRVDEAAFRFAPPTLEATAEAVHREEGVALRLALGQLAEQDPLINVRLDRGGGLVVSLYGEVQKEVLAAMLANEYGLEVAFRETTPICVERVRGVGSATELLRDPANPYAATVALRVAPGPVGSGIAFGLSFDSRRVPLYIFKTHEEFFDAMQRLVTSALDEGLLGWRVTDCVVTMTDCDYYVGDGRVPAGTTRTSAADFRKLTPLVLRRALERAGTVVCEPYVVSRAQVPVDSLSATMSLAARLGGVVTSATTQRELADVTIELAAARAQVLHRELPGVTAGEGSVESTFLDYRPARDAGSRAHAHPDRP